jgi:enoyl-CoA hydratase/carnithine racemase
MGDGNLAKGAVMNSTFTVTVDESKVAVLTVDQPGGKANVFSRPLLQELAAALDQLEGQKGLRGLVCRSGKPGMFIAGADLKELGAGTIAGEAAVRFAEEGQQLFSRLERLPCPTVCVIEGPALGGGMEFALCFDARVVVDHPKTQLGLPETKLGLLPGWGGTQRLPRLVGEERALAMILDGTSVTAGDTGTLAEVVVASDSALAEANRVIERLHAQAEWQRRRDVKYGAMAVSAEEMKRVIDGARAEISALTDASALAKRTVVELMERTSTMDLFAGLQEEAKAFGRVAGTPESKQLIAEFFAARAKPKG